MVFLKCSFKEALKKHANYFKDVDNSKIQKFLN